MEVPTPPMFQLHSPEDCEAALSATQEPNLLEQQLHLAIYVSFKVQFHTLGSMRLCVNERIDTIL